MEVMLLILVVRTDLAGTPFFLNVFYACWEHLFGFVVRLERQLVFVEVCFRLLKPEDQQNIYIFMNSCVSLCVIFFHSEMITLSQIRNADTMSEVSRWIVCSVKTKIKLVKLFSIFPVRQFARWRLCRSFHSLTLLMF